VTGRSVPALPWTAVTVAATLRPPCRATQHAKPLRHSRPHLTSASRHRFANYLVGSSNRRKSVERRRVTPLSLRVQCACRSRPGYGAPLTHPPGPGLCRDRQDLGQWAHLYEIAPLDLALAVRSSNRAQVCLLRCHGSRAGRPGPGHRCPGGSSSRHSEARSE
jgi:hypothetical protein